VILQEKENTFVSNYEADREMRQCNSCVPVIDDVWRNLSFNIVSLFVYSFVQ
jgi:hypothetical protein